MATTLNNIYVTLYGYADNDPPGSDTTSLGGHAGGSGTYDDPVTAAANPAGLSGQFAYGTKFYVPELQKYFVIADYMANTSGGENHVDLWVQSNASTPASQSNAAENALTGNYQLILDPPSNQPVNTTPLVAAANDLSSVVGDNADITPVAVVDSATPTNTNTNTDTAPVNQANTNQAGTNDGTDSGRWSHSGHHHGHHHRHHDDSGSADDWSFHHWNHHG